jgi:ribosomal RNA assembly protein
MSGGVGVKPRMYVKIPPERLGAVIGEEGSVKKEISRRLGVSINIDTVNSMAVIEPEADNTPPVNVVKAAEIVKAIAYGFTPDKAMSLLNEDYVLVVVDLKELLGDKENHLRRRMVIEHHS